MSRRMNFQVRVEVVDAPVHQPRRVEDPVPAVDHVIIERDDHQRRIGDDASKLAGVERRVADRLAGPQGLQGSDDVGGGQGRELR